MNLNLPSPTGGAYNYDSIKTENGSTCRQAVGSTTNLEVGTLVSEDGSGALYGRISMALGDRPSRLNCKTLYDLEIAKLREELELMRMAFEMK